MAVGLFTNSSRRQDFMRNAISDAAESVEQVFIASAFFTEAEVIQRFVDKGRQVRLIVRLGFPTSPDALVKVMKMQGVQVRFFTDASFHPKLFIFGNQSALVGSANLTTAATMTNQEVVVSIGPNDERLSELAVLFNEYWSAATVLTADFLEKYQSIYQKYQRAVNEIYAMEQLVTKDIGIHVFHNIQRDTKKQSTENLFLDSYRKTYQESVAAYRLIAAIYSDTGKRKFTEETIPLRLEIDSFFSFVRDKYTQGESWNETPEGWNEARRSQLRECIVHWFSIEWPHFERTIVQNNYPRLKELFVNESVLLASGDDQLFDALLTSHSFHDRLRFFKGGIPGLRAAFLGGNEPHQIRASLVHLVFGKVEPIRRMANLLFDSQYKLNEFGTANVQELVGWLNHDDLPVINARTTKILRYFGHSVQQL